MSDDQKTATKHPQNDQQFWFDMIQRFGEPAARQQLINRLRAAADQIERGGYPDVFGCRIVEGDDGPMSKVSVTLSDVWGG